MTDPRQRRPDCVDDETLAALVDGELDAVTRKRVEAHLAVCEDCYEIVVESARLGEGAADDLSDAADGGAARGRLGARRGFAAIGLLAAAAVAWLAVAPPAFFVRWRDPHSRPELRELVAAVGNARRTEGRLTGGFAWGPPPTEMRGSGDEIPPGIRLAAARLEQDLQRERTARTVAASGTARLVSGRPEDAVVMLGAAAELNPSDSAIWSDLSAAHLAAAVGGDQARLQRALEAAETSIRLDAARAEPWFNKALALERLGRRNDARDAWERFIALEGVSPWSDEAQAHLRELRLP